MSDDPYALKRAVRANDRPEVARLLEAGANPNFPDVLNGSRPLHDAVRDHQIPIAALLIQHGARVNVPTQNTGATPLGCAALVGARRMVEFLIRHGARLSPSEWASELPAEVLADGERAIHDLLIRRDDDDVVFETWR